MSRRRFALVVAVALAGCRENLLDGLPDAAEPDIDADIPTPAGDFSCVGLPYPETATDPLTVRGVVLANGAPLGGVPVEIYRATDDTLLAQDLTNATTGDRLGKYSVSLATGGVAPRIYRKAIGASNRPDFYQYDGIPVSSSYEMSSITFNEATTTAFHDIAGIPRDLTKGMLIFGVYDCTLPPTDHVVVGATVETPTGATVVYVAEDGTLNPALTETSSHGGFLILNVTPGRLDLRVHAGPVVYREWEVRAFANSWTAGPRHP